MLKAELINRSIKIYYKNSSDRTLSLSDCVSKIYSDVNIRIRLNTEIFTYSQEFVDFIIKYIQENL